MALVKESAYEDLINELRSFQSTLLNDANYLVQSANLCAQAMQQDEVSTTLVSRVGVCCTKISDLEEKVAAFKRDLEDELQAIREARKSDSAE